MGNSLASTTLPYVIEEETHPPTRSGSYGFSIHRGYRKSDNLPVTVFKADKKNLASTPLTHSTVVIPTISSSYLLPSFHHIQKLRTILHPSILRAYSTLDTDLMSNKINDTNTTFSLQTFDENKVLTTGSLLVVTERVIPLDDYLIFITKSSKNNNSLYTNRIVWGLKNIVTALSFLHTTAKLSHGNIHPSSIFVTPSGDFKLSQFHLISNINGIHTNDKCENCYFQKYEKFITPQVYRSPERIQYHYHHLNPNDIHVIDVYSLGALINELFSSHSLLPPFLKDTLRTMQTKQFSFRPTLDYFLTNPIFNCLHIHIRQKIHDIKNGTLSTHDRLSFWQVLPEHLRSEIIYPETAKHTLWYCINDHLIAISKTENAMSQHLLRQECSFMLPALFTLLEYCIPSYDLKKYLTPKFLQCLWSLNNRGIRSILLRQIPFILPHLNDTTINRYVFDPMCSGFTDTYAPLRELTLEMIPSLTPHLYSSSIEKIGRYLLRLQSDPKKSIRSKAINYVGLIAGKLSQGGKDKLILPVFTRAMKDQCELSRMEALNLILTCLQWFDMNMIARSVLPCVTPHLIDENITVRKEAFNVVGKLIKVIQLKIIESDNEKVTGYSTVNSAVGMNISGKKNVMSFISNKTKPNTSILFTDQNQKERKKDFEYIKDYKGLFSSKTNSFVTSMSFSNQDNNYSHSHHNFRFSKVDSKSVDTSPFLNHTYSSLSSFPTSEINSFTRLSSFPSGWSDDEESLILDENDKFDTENSRKIHC